VSTDVGSTKFGQVPFDLQDKTAPSMWTNSTWTLAQAADNCWASEDCTGFTYVGGVSTMYGNAFVLDSGSVGNTYVKFDWMDKSGMGQKTTKYTDTASAGGFSIESQYFKSDNAFVAPPATGDYDNDLKYFKKESNPNWNAGKDKRGADPKKITGVSTANLCANVCMSNASCKSFVFKDGAKECYFRGDLSRDNDTNYVCNAKTGIDGTDPANTKGCNGLNNLVPIPDTDPGNGVVFGCGGRATGYCWHVGGSFSETGSQTYWKLQDSMDKQCPEKCGQNSLCQASQWNKNDCSIFEFGPTVKAQDTNFTTQWKFDYFPGN
jgi:hypothetical protein